MELQRNDDRELVQQLLAGSEQAFDAFFDGYFPRLYRFALGRMDRHEQEVQDIVQTTLMKGIKAIAGFRGDASLFTWLCQICRNEINQWYRTRHIEQTIVVEEDEGIRDILENLSADEHQEPENLVESAQLQRLVQSILDHLPANYGDVLEWKYVQGWSVAMIARELGITDLAAQSMLARARVAFRGAIEDITRSPALRRRGGVK